MLKGNFYSIIQKKEIENELYYWIKLNENHEIYKGHFPEVSVTPGVCQVTIIKECLEEKLKKKISLISAREIKFPNLNNPKENSEILVKIVYDLQEDDTFKVLASISAENSIFLKLKGEYSAGSL